MATTRSDVMSGSEAQALLDGMTPGTLTVERAIAVRVAVPPADELALVIRDVPREHEGRMYGLEVCRGMDGPTREGNAAALASVKRALAAVVARDAEVERLTRDRDDLQARLDAAVDAARELGAVAAGAVRERGALAGAVRRQIGALLASNGCDCECEHSADEHDDDCERCLACRVESALAGCP